jgi:hypothetical protein
MYPCATLTPVETKVAKDTLPRALIGASTMPEPSVLEALQEDRGERKEHLSANGKC